MTHKKTVQEVNSHIIKIIHINSVIYLKMIVQCLNLKEEATENFLTCLYPELVSCVVFSSENQHRAVRRWSKAVSKEWISTNKPSKDQNESEKTQRRKSELLIITVVLKGFISKWVWSLWLSELHINTTDTQEQEELFYLKTPTQTLFHIIIHRFIYSVLHIIYNPPLWKCSERICEVWLII